MSSKALVVRGSFNGNKQQDVTGKGGGFVCKDFSVLRALQPYAFAERNSSLKSKLLVEVFL